MPRPIRCRRIWRKPRANYFKPAGIRTVDLEEIVLALDEYEAIRLVDFEEVGQIKAAQKMKVSQPTLSRILKSARKKMSDAIINGKAIKIKGGEYKMAQPKRSLGMRKGIGVGGHGRMGGVSAGPGGICKCPNCGYELSQVRGQPCNKRKCPKCKSLMTRG